MKYVTIFFPKATQTTLTGEDLDNLLREMDELKKQLAI